MNPGRPTGHSSVAGERGTPTTPGTAVRRCSEWLRPQQVTLDVAARTRTHALELAAAWIGRAHGIDAKSVYRALMRREEAGSTALGLGVAIPHARVAGIERPATFFMRTRYPIDFNAPDGKPVSGFLVIMVPADGATDDHLQLLALAASALSDREFRMSLAAATTAAQVDAAFAALAEPLRQRRPTD